MSFGFTKPDGIVYINLDSRPDRRAQIEREIASYLQVDGEHAKPIPVVRIAGSVFQLPGRPNGAIGCTDSHRKAMAHIREAGWKTALVFEDDFVWLGDVTKHAARIEWFLDDEDLGKTDRWGFVQIAHSPESFREYRRTAYAPDLYRVSNAGNASGYLVNNQPTPGKPGLPAAAARLETIWTDAVKAMLSGASDATHISDVAWEQLRREMPCYAFVPRLGRQSAGFSDILGRHADYL